MEEKLFPLTLRNSFNSIMRKRMFRIIDGLQSDDVAVLAFKNKDIVAWTLTFDIEIKEPKFMIFVDPKFGKLLTSQLPPAQGWLTYS